MRMDYVYGILASPFFCNLISPEQLLTLLEESLSDAVHKTNSGMNEATLEQ